MEWNNGAHKNFVVLAINVKKRSENTDAGWGVPAG